MQKPNRRTYCCTNYPRLHRKDSQQIWTSTVAIKVHIIRYLVPLLQLLHCMSDNAYAVSYCTPTTHTHTPFIMCTVYTAYMYIQNT